MKSAWIYSSMFARWAEQEQQRHRDRNIWEQYIWRKNEQTAAVGEGVCESVCTVQGGGIRSTSSTAVIRSDVTDWPTLHSFQPHRLQMALGQEGITPWWSANLLPSSKSVCPTKISILKSRCSGVETVWVRRCVCECVCVVHVWWFGVVQTKSLHHSGISHDIILHAFPCLSPLHFLINCSLSWKSTHTKLHRSPLSLSTALLLTWSLLVFLWHVYSLAHRRMLCNV